MARPVTGDEQAIEHALQVISQATTVEQLRQAQAVVLPLVYGLSLEQTAQVTGVSLGWVCQLRRRFIAGDVAGTPEMPCAGGRRRQNMTVEQEAQFLASFIDKAQAGGVLVVGEIKAALEERLAREVAKSSVYNLLHRHNWRKLVPDKRHPKSDPAAQQAWKKNSPKRSKASLQTGPAASPSS